MEIIVAILVIALIVFIITIPAKIARARGISGSELTTISLLCWVSLLVGLTWFIALILALVWQPTNWVEKDEHVTDYDALEKLHSLKERGILSEDEYKKERAKIIK